MFEDYAPVSQKLKFGVGETTKTFEVDIIEPKQLALDSDESEDEKYQPDVISTKNFKIHLEKA